MPKLVDLADCPAPPILSAEEAAKHQGRISKTYDIEIITPMFGGGVKAGEIDTSMPIRATAIRGHLRFWWRATKGTDLSPKEMWRREEEIFGSIKFPSPLTVRVLVQPTIELRDPTPNDRSGPITYALFAAVSNQNQVAEAGGTFRLQLGWDGASMLKAKRRAQNAQRKDPLPADIESISGDIEAAMKAWVNFGGIGARTRRGCGALYCEALAVNSISELTKLIKATILTKPQTSSNDAWKLALTTYRDFRQKPGFARTLRRPRPGRSFYPEANAIRAITGWHNEHHFPGDDPPLFFPRAVFGLPIGFQFPQNNGDPKDTVLYPTTADGSLLDRMASPIITRPLRLRSGDNHALLARLSTPKPSHLLLKLVDGTRERRFTADHIGGVRLTTEPLKIAHDGNTKSALDVFFEYARTQGYNEGHAQ